MKTDLYYFSGTGNGLNIAKLIKEQLEQKENETVKILPMTKFDFSKNIVSKAERVGLIYPTYDIDAPNVVKEFAKQICVEKDAYVFIYANSGGLPGRSVYSIKEILNERSIEVSNAFHAVYPDNSVLKPIKKEDIDKKIREAKIMHIKDSKAIFKRAKNPAHPLFKFSAINHVATKVVDMYFQKFIGFKDIRVDETTCNGCGICQKVCPMKNIKMEDKLPEFDNKCEMCFACIHACPKKSLRYRRMAKRDDFQYRHPEVSLKEMILNQ